MGFLNSNCVARALDVLRILRICLVRQYPSRFLLPLLLLMPSVAGAQDFTYTIANNEVTITGYTGSATDVSVPATVEGLPVIAIGDEAFLDQNSMTSITIPDSVTSIGDFAFSSCNDLKTVILGNGVTTIGENAFRFCIDLTSITLPDSLTTIGDSAFSQCESLTSITIPDSVITIGESAFDWCLALTDLIIGNSVTTIGDYAFSTCNSLTKITIPESVKIIGDYVFVNCLSLTSIMVDSNNEEYIDRDGVLYNKDVTRLIAFPSGRGGNYTIPNSVGELENGAFWSCAGLTSITLPDSVTTIPEAAFYSCNSLKSITIPDSVTTIGGSAFFYCSELTSIYFKGDAPGLGNSTVFYSVDATIYYLPGTAGWGATYDDRPTVLWDPEVRMDDATFGVIENQFGFTVDATDEIPVLVEASSTANGQEWEAVEELTLTDGSAYFSDPDWANFPVRFYRLAFP